MDEGVRAGAEALTEAGTEGLARLDGRARAPRAGR